MIYLRGMFWLNGGKKGLLWELGRVVPLGSDYWLNETSYLFSHELPSNIQSLGREQNVLFYIQCYTDTLFLLGLVRSYTTSKFRANLFEMFPGDLEVRLISILDTSLTHLLTVIGEIIIKEGLKVDFHLSYYCNLFWVRKAGSQ